MICERYEAHQWTAWALLVNPGDPQHYVRRCTRCGAEENRWA